MQGLGSNPNTTWQPRQTDRSEDSITQTNPNTIWFRDFLPQDLHEDGLKIRAMAFNHYTGWQANALSKSLEDYVQDLLRELGEERRSAEVSNYSFGTASVWRSLLVTQFSVLKRGRNIIS